MSSVAKALQSDEMAEFLRKQRRFVLDEAENTKQQIYQLWSKPVRERVQADKAIAQVHVAQVAADGKITLVCERNNSRFREGDMLRLNRGNPFSAPFLDVTVEMDDETTLIVSTEDPAAQWGDILKERNNWVLDESFLDFSHMILEALDEVGDTLIGRERILPILMGRMHPLLDGQRSEYAYQWGQADEQKKLNDHQCEALANAYATDSVYLIQGPPGTGKTKVLSRLAQLLVEDGERVLVTAFTHRAINNALNTIAGPPSKPSFVTCYKIGASSRSDDLNGVESYESFRESPLPDLSGGYIVGATPFATRSQRLKGIEFDTVIFDEASQVTLPLAVMGMLAAKRFIFIGDHRQLPPVLTTRYTGGAFRASVFGALVDHGFDTMLTDTYRLNAELTEWPSQQFYDGELRSMQPDRRIRYPTPPARLQHILDPEKPKVFVDLEHRNTTVRSHKEAELIVDLIKTLLETGFPASEIGVVAPYRAQRREIYRLLRRMLPTRSAYREIVIDTVERMQGQERELIILSLTTSSAAFALQIADFFFQEERLNVAVTRPKSKLIIVGSRHVLSIEPESLEHQLLVERFHSLLESCDRCRYSP